MLDHREFRPTLLAMVGRIALHLRNLQDRTPRGGRIRRARATGDRARVRPALLEILVTQVGREPRLDVELGTVVGPEEPGFARLCGPALVGQVVERVSILRAAVLSPSESHARGGYRLPRQRPAGFGPTAGSPRLDPVGGRGYIYSALRRADVRLVQGVSRPN
jgi:hypothetical protein